MIITALLLAFTYSIWRRKVLLIRGVDVLSWLLLINLLAALLTGLARLV